MQKYVQTIEDLLDQDCSIKIYKNAGGTFTVKVNDEVNLGFGTNKYWRKALVLAKQDFQNYKKY